MSDDDPTDNPEYWKEWAKVSRKREAQVASPQEYSLSDDQLANYPSYGWPLRCSWCRFGVTRIKAQDCDGVTFLCGECGRPNIVRRSGNLITISPGTRISWRMLLVTCIVIALILWWLFA